jgi:2-polyprenyl-6-hydroxyphenyl methylase/3-demethylubiquinone-9 3-methyltransferase
MKRRHAPISDWNILQGSALDEAFLRSLGKFDLIYSWGVLHHTGQMWKALDLITIPAKNMLLVSLYADQGVLSRTWRLLKRIYVHHPLSRGPIKATALSMMWAPKLRFGPWHAIHEWKHYNQKRGMSAWHDIVDWAGGYPYEFAKPAEVISFYAARGFSLRSSPPSHGVIRVNQYLFESATA